MKWNHSSNYKYPYKVINQKNKNNRIQQIKPLHAKIRRKIQRPGHYMPRSSRGGRGARGRWSMGQSRRRDGGRRGAGTATVSQFGDGGCLGDEQGGSPGRRARAAGACERRGGGFWTRRWRRQPVRGEGRRGPVRGGGCGINLLKFPSGRTLYIAWTVA
jgi:hypothetical protein